MRVFLNIISALEDPRSLLEKKLSYNSGKGGKAL